MRKLTNYIVLKKKDCSKQRVSILCDPEWKLLKLIALSGSKTSALLAFYCQAAKNGGTLAQKPSTLS
jgi:hypothetical protein